MAVRAPPLTACTESLEISNTFTNCESDMPDSAPQNSVSEFTSSAKPRVCDCGQPVHHPRSNRCDRCKKQDPHRNGHRRRKRGEIAVGVDCESAANPTKHHVDLDMFENDMVTFSFGREDGTSGSIKALSGSFLTMADVFDFILKNLSGDYIDAGGIRYRQALFGFHFNHDIGMMVKDLKIDQMYLVHKSTAKERGLLCGTEHKPEDEECIRYHRFNRADVLETLSQGGEGDILAFDPTSKFAFATTAGRRFYMEYRPNGDRFEGNKRIDVHDVGMAFPGKFEQVIDKWKPELRPGDREIIAWGKAQRLDNFLHVDRDKIAAYSEAECVSLARLIRLFVTTLKDATGLQMDLTKLFGSGSVAGEVLKFNMVTERKMVHEEIKVIHGTMVDDIGQLCYYGGKIEAPVIGILTEDGHPRDINSAYPSQMIHLPCMAAGHGHWEDKRGKRKLAARTVGYALVTWEIPHGATDFPPFMVRDDTASVFCPRVGQRIWVTLPEYAKAMEYWGQYIVTHHMTWWIQDCGCPPPLSFLSEVYNKRYIEKARAKKALAEGDMVAFGAATAREEVYKLIINSCYGKLAQREPTFGKFTNMHWAAMITGETRAQINEEVWSGERAGGTAIYAHTDSVTFVGLEREDQGKALGAWGKEDAKVKLFNIQPGLSIAIGSEKHATRGVSKAVIVPFARRWAEEHAEEFLSHPTTWSTMQVADTRMYSLRQAVHIGKPWLAGSFRTAPQKIGFRSAKREFDRAVPMGGNNPTAWKVPPKEIIHPDDVARLEDLQSYRNHLRQLRREGAWDSDKI